MLNDLLGFIDEAVELASASAQICVRVDSVEVGAFEVFIQDLSLTSHVSSAA